MTEFGVGDYPNNIEVRRWAQDQPWGHKVPVTGRMPAGVFKAWDRAHPDRPYAARDAYHGTTGGYENHGCKCRRCLDAWNAYHSDRRSA